MIPKDKLLHLALGGLSIVCVMAALAIYNNFGLGACFAFTTTAVGVLYEIQQWYRKEGQPDIYDALATAVPGWVAWALLEVLK
jgi:hypothetical protein